jgi:hypothetical protein
MRLFHPPLRISIFYGSRDKLQPGSLLHKRKEPWNEVADYLGFDGFEQDIARFNYKYTRSSTVL